MDNPANSFATVTVDDLTIDDDVIETPGSVITVAAGTGIEAANLSRNMRVEGTGGVTVSATPSIANGSAGEVITLTGTSDADYVILEDETTLAGSNLKFSNANRRKLGLNDKLTLQFDGSDWVETCYAGKIGTKKIILVSSGTYTLTEADSGSICAGYSNDVEFDLPTTQKEGMYYEFFVYSGNKYVQINAGAGHSIRLGAGGATAAGGYVRSKTRTAAVGLWSVADGGSQWQKIGSFIYGWTYDS